MNQTTPIAVPVVHPSDVIKSIDRDPAGTYQAYRGNHEADELRLLPERMHPGIARYILCGIKPGSFLTAIFADNFENARHRADDENAALLSNYRNFLENGCPATCWGTPETVQAWCESGGLVGLMQRANVSA